MFTNTNPTNILFIRAYRKTVEAIDTNLEAFYDSQQLPGLSLDARQKIYNVLYT